MPSRLDDLKRFYAALDLLRDRVGGARTLSECNGRMPWPTRGVYFFFEPGEARSDSGTGGRVVRVGTHALTAKSKTTLWNRLSQHRGVAASNGGNHRGSIFRLYVGTAILKQAPDISCLTWANGNNAPPEIRKQEQHVEKRVSEHIGKMPFLWLEIDDPPGDTSLRAYVERNSIALLSNFQKPPLDAPSPTWLGRCCKSERVQESGLWNYQHVDKRYEDIFLDRLEKLIERGSGH